jgi:hypothetical protein
MADKQEQEQEEVILNETEEYIQKMEYVEQYRFIFGKSQYL